MSKRFGVAAFKITTGSGDDDVVHVRGEFIVRDGFSLHDDGHKVPLNGVYLRSSGTLLLHFVSPRLVELSDDERQDDGGEAFREAVIRAADAVLNGMTGYESNLSPHTHIYVSVV